MNKLKKTLKEYQKLSILLINITGKRYGLEKIRHAYKSKYSLNREKQVILLMITDGKRWHYLAVKSLSGLFRGITSKHDGDFYCIILF